jgi:hypothetical protein
MPTHSSNSMRSTHRERAVCFTPILQNYLHMFDIIGIRVNKDVKQNEIRSVFSL